MVLDDCTLGMASIYFLWLFLGEIGVCIDRYLDHLVALKVLLWLFLFGVEFG